MDELQVFKNSEFGSIRTLLIDGEQHFVGRDIAEILGYSNTKDAIATHVYEAVYYTHLDVYKRQVI